jgi:hypothetical protein
MYLLQVPPMAPIRTQPRGTEHAHRTSADEYCQARQIGTSVCAVATRTGNLGGR